MQQVLNTEVYTDEVQKKSLTNTIVPIMIKNNDMPIRKRKIYFFYRENVYVFLFSE